jgi:transcriptional regulator with XRE-family HTH domain
LEVGDRIRELRKSLKISQAELAKKIGVSSGNVGDWERGRAKPGVDALINLSKFFNKSIDWLITGEEPKCSYDEYPDEIVLKKQDIKILPLSDTERDIVKKFRELSKEDKNNIKQIMSLKSNNDN